MKTSMRGNRTDRKRTSSQARATRSRTARGGGARPSGARPSGSIGRRNSAASSLRQERQESAYRSRDLSSGSTMLLTKPTLPEVDFAPAPVPTKPRKSKTVTPVAAPKRKFQRKAGSQQVFSERGKRIVRPKADPAKVRFTVFLTVLLAVGLLGAMWLSGKATEQAFKIQTLTNDEIMLRDQVETLNRDLQNASATAEIARQAQELGMVVPDQPGILSRDAAGVVTEQRAPSDLTRPIVDVNGQQVKPQKASSDPAATDEVASNINETPQRQAPVVNVAPYAASISTSD